MGKWLAWFSPTSLLGDLTEFEGARIYVALSQLDKDDYVETLCDDADRIEKAGLKIMLCIDYHVQHPVYHGPPPPFKSDACLGYAPFSWVRGWIWAREHIAMIVQKVRPDAVQIAEDPHYREGWGFFRDDDNAKVAEYNDNMLIFKQAIIADCAQPDLLVVIPETPGSSVQQRGVLHAKKSFADGAGFTNVVREQDLRWAEVVPDKPVFEDDDDDELDPEIDAEVDDVRSDDYDASLPVSQRLALRAYNAAVKRDFNKAVKLMKRARRVARGEE